MRRGNFFRRHQYKIAAVCIAAAILAVAGTYMLTPKETEETPKQQTAVLEEKESVKKEVAQQKKEKTKKDEKTEVAEKSKKVSTIVYPKREDVIRTSDYDLAATQDGSDAAQEETVETSSIQPAATEVHFNQEAGLLWPVDGPVILDYSMDQTIYFATLDQYKYNPAVIISGNVNDQVKAAANGKITDISTNEVTGCTVTMDLGDGYTAIYGQLKEVPYEAGAYLEAGNSLGFVSEPTKYYSVEGSNLYFALEKDGVPVDPVEFFQ